MASFFRNIIVGASGLLASAGALTAQDFQGQCQNLYEAARMTPEELETGHLSYEAGPEQPTMAQCFSPTTAPISASSYNEFARKVLDAGIDLALVTERIKQDDPDIQLDRLSFVSTQNFTHDGLEVQAITFSISGAYDGQGEASREMYLFSQHGDLTPFAEIVD